MVKNHLKSIAVPKLWKIERKKNVFTAKPNPGKTLKTSLPLLLVLRDFLGVVKTKQEAMKVINSKHILVNGKKRSDLNYPVGLFDVVEIKETNEHHRLSLSDKGYLTLVKISKEEAHHIPLKIIGKKKIGAKVQLNLFNGVNLLVDKDAYKTHDSIMLDVATNKSKAHLSLEKGAKVLVVSGRNIGKRGAIESIEGKTIKVKTKDAHIETTKEHIYIISDEKSTITV